MAGSPTLAAYVQLAEQLLIEVVGLLLVDPGQRRARHRSRAQVIELWPLRLKVGDNVAQAVPPRQMAGGDRYEL